jgi:phage-related protein
MQWEIEYYSEKVRTTIDAWPVGIRAFYARTVDRIMIYGPELPFPFTRSIGNKLFEIRAIGKQGIGRAFYCTDKTPLRELETARKRLQEVQYENT